MPWDKRRRWDLPLLQGDYIVECGVKTSVNFLKITFQYLTLDIMHLGVVSRRTVLPARPYRVLLYSAILVAALIETEGLVGYLAYLQTNHNNSYTFSPCSSFFNLQHIKKNAHSSIYFYFNCILSRASSGCTVNYETCPYRLLPSKLLFSLVTVALQ